MGGRIRVGLLALASACSMASDHASQYRCDDDHACPGNQVCRGGLCVLDGPTDAMPEVDGYEQAVLADGPAGYWRLDELEGSTAADRSGNGNDGTYAGIPGLGVAGAASRTGTAVSFDGVDDHAVVPDAPRLRLADSFTVEAWVRADGPPTSEFSGLVSKQGDAGFVFFYYQWGELLRPSFVRGEGTERAVTEAGILAEDRFRHYAIVYDQPEELVSWYVDGVLDGAYAVVYPEAENLSPIELGRNNIHYALVSIDEVAIYDEALSAARILAHVEAAAP